ncbi:MAG: hypothetical protein D6753_01360 [Planctomycetota bacterium]|nr:MAG: hypothetical protein D6753_01360 [Planctomycetota bacterium]
MRIQNHVPHNLLVLTLVVACTCTGCRSSGWKMPGAGLFSWNRDPDPATLAGDTSQGEFALPESPASKYDPTAIVSSGTSSATGDAVAQATADAASAYGYTAANTSTPTAGSPTAANGYQTGPYQMSGFTSPATGQVPGAAATSANAALPSPYGGTYPASATVPPAVVSQSAAASAPQGPAASDIPLPNSVTNAMNQTAGGTYPGAVTPGATSSTSTAPVGTHGLPPVPTETASLPNPYAGLPQSPGSPSASGSAGLPSYPSLPPIGSAPAVGGSGTPASGSTVPTNALPAPSSALPPPSTALPSAPINRPSGYAPGTTGRPTKYDFSTGSGAGSGTSTGYALPPNTATGGGSLLR